jgi:hypothetical protein
LLDSDGNVKFQHEDKASLLWDAFKERLGHSEFYQMHFDMDSLLEPIPALDDMATPFSTEEIDLVVRNLKAEKSPGGFNTNFMKKWWDIIKFDFYELCSGFFNHNICLQSINGSFITLVPKVDNPSRVGDFRPISLLNNLVNLCHTQFYAKTKYSSYA